MADQTSLPTEVFQRLNPDLLAAKIPPRDREQVLAMANFLNADMAAMRKFPVGEAEPATKYDPSAEA